MVQHDAIAPLGHDRQFVAALVGPHAKTKKTQAQRVADIFDLFQMRSEEHTSELQSLMRISYAVFCLKKKKKPTHTSTKYNHIKRVLRTHNSECRISRHT